MCVFKTEFEQADLAKKRVALFGRKQSLDDRLSMVFVNLTIGAVGEPVAGNPQGGCAA